MLKELLIKDRSVRSFNKSVIISEESLCDMIEYTRYCPSSANMQVLKFRPVVGEEAEKVFPLTKWAGYLKNEQIPPKGHECSAFIVICFDKSISGSCDAFMKDVGICAEVILLRATEKGLGGCMIGSFDKKGVVEVLGLAENLDPALVLAVGCPDEAPVITDVCDGDIKYYRKDGTHYVPKRSLSEIIIK